MASTMGDSVNVDVPPADAWAFITDPPKLHALQMNGTVRLLSGTFDTVASRYLVTTRVYGRLWMRRTRSCVLSLRACSRRASPRMER